MVLPEVAQWLLVLPAGAGSWLEAPWWAQQWEFPASETHKRSYSAGSSSSTNTESTNQQTDLSKSICSASSLTHNTGSVCHMNSLIHIVQWAHSAVVTNTNHKGSCSYIKPQHSCMLGNRFINLNLRLFCSDKSNRSSGAGRNEKLRLSELLRGWSHETYNFIRRNLPQEVVQFPASR